MILTIGITSYNRPKELKRCLNSIDTIFVNDIEILISDDCSPLLESIKQVVSEFTQKKAYNIKFYSNEINLGYDRNLGQIICRSSGDYILFISDDDMLYEYSLDKIVNFLNTNNKYALIYNSFKYFNNSVIDRRHANNFEIYKGEQNAYKLIYDSILFSGLIFRKTLIQKIDATRFLNLNYFQVYLFLYSIYYYGGYYIKEPLIVCVGDGENGYGVSESSGGNEILANRKSIISNLEFNKSLFITIKMFDSDCNANVFKKFEHLYSLHSYTGLSIARQGGMEYYLKYWSKLKSLDIKLYPIVYIYYIILKIFGTPICNFILSIPKNIIRGN